MEEFQGTNEEERRETQDVEFPVTWICFKIEAAVFL
jgi:hypothetical protein